MTSRAKKKKGQRRSLALDTTAVPQYLRTLDPNVRGYFTAYVDILGTAKALRDLDGAMEANNSAAIADIVWRTAGSILRFRQTFKDFIGEYDHRNSSTVKFGAELPTAAHTLWRDFKKQVPFYMHSFSDGIALSVPIDAKNMLATLRAIHMTLHSIAGASLLLAIERGQLVRGGVALGYGCTIGGKEVLGAGLAKAAAMDKTGKLPRVEVDHSLRDLLDDPAPDYPDDNANRLCSLLRHACRAMLVNDGDSYYVNFLSGDQLEVVRNFAKMDAPLEHMDLRCTAARDRAIGDEVDVGAQEKIRSKYDWFLGRIREAQLAAARTNAV
jgi:hypothetical protein